MSYLRKPRNRKYGNPSVWGEAGVATAPRATAAAQKQQPSLYGQAQSIAEMQIKAMLDEVRRQQDTARDQADLEAQRELAKGQAIAYGLQQLGIAPQIQNIFDTAGQNIAGLAQGFSGATRDQASAQAAEQQRLLAGTGQEGAVRNEGAAMGNVTYGTGGFIPGNELVSQGAGFSAQAALQPGFATQFGQLAEAERRRQWAAELKDWANKRADVIGKKPALFQDALGNAQDERDYQFKVWQIETAAYQAAHPQAKIVIRNNALGQQQAWDVTPGKVPHPIGGPVGPARSTQATTHTKTVIKNGVPHTIVYNENWEPIKDLGPSGTKGGAGASGKVSTIKATLAANAANWTTPVELDGPARLAALQWATDKGVSQKVMGKITTAKYVADKRRFYKNGRWFGVLPGGVTNDPKKAAWSGGTYEQILAKALDAAAELYALGWSEAKVKSWVKAQLRAIGIS